MPGLYLETLLTKREFKPLINRSGLNCRIVLAGVTQERIEWCEPAFPGFSDRLANEAAPLEPWQDIADLIVTGKTRRPPF